MMDIKKCINWGKIKNKKIELPTAARTPKKYFPSVSIKKITRNHQQLHKNVQF